MLTRIYNLLLLLDLSIIIATAGCESPPNPTQTLDEVKQLATRLEARNSSYDFTALGLLRGVSNDTLDFLAQDFTQDEKNNAPEPRVKLLLSFREHLVTFTSYNKALTGKKYTYLRLQITAPPDVPKVQITADLKTVLTDGLAKLSQDNHSIYGDGKLYAKVYCSTDCSCLANRLGHLVQKAAPDMAVLYLMITGGAPDGGVGTIPSDQKPLPYSTMNHHVVAVVGDPQGGWGVIDPLVFGDAEPRSILDWYKQFQHDTPMVYRVYTTDDPLVLGG